MTATPPVPTGAPPAIIRLTGRLVPFDADNQPVWIEIPDSPHRYLPIFDTQRELVHVLAKAGIRYEKIKRIDDGREFLESIPRRWMGQDVKIITRIRFMPDGRLRYFEAKWD